MAVEHGALVLADLSGYTRYLGGVELEHSHDVLADLLGTIASQLDAAGLSLAKVEGDCVFSAGDVDDVELRTAIETTYCVFRGRRRAISKATSCACDACRRIDDLDLKFVAHRGSWVAHDVAGSTELTGPDVIVAHRLLKNEVAAPGAYALVTADSGAHVEQVDGTSVAADVLDLEAVWTSYESRRPVLVSATEAVLTFEREVAEQPPLVFEVISQPEHQRRWRVGITSYDVVDDRESRGVGTKAHCVHGRTVIEHEIVDWRPPERYSFRERNPIGGFLWSIEVAPTPTGSHVTMRLALGGGTRQRLLFPVLKRVLKKKVDENMDAMKSYLEALPD